MATPPSRGARGDGFGIRIHPISGVRRMHNGEDGLGVGNYAPVSGTVTYAGWHGPSGFGYAVSIREDAHPDKPVWTVAHHESVAVRVGQSVVEDVTYLGPKGSTGASTGPHAHTERRTGSNGTPLSGTATDPRAYYGSFAGGGVGGFIPTERHSDMYLLRTLDGAVALVTANGMVNIASLEHLDLFTRLFKAYPSWETFNSDQRAVIAGYIQAANTADDAETTKILDALSKITIDPAPVVAAVAAEIARQGVSVDLSPLEAAIESGFAAVNANIDDQPTRFTIEPTA